MRIIIFIITVIIIIINNDNNNNNYNSIIIIIMSVYYSKTVLMCNLRYFNTPTYFTITSTDDNVYLYMMCNMKAM